MQHPDTRTSSVRHRRAPRRLLLGAGLLSLALPLSACGGHGSAEGRPSVKELTESLTSGPLADEMGLDQSVVPRSAFTCVAQKLEQSDLSDAALRALVKADKEFQPSDADQKALTGIASQMVSCASQ